MSEGERAVAASMIRSKPFALRDNPALLGWTPPPPTTLSSRSTAPPPSYAAVPWTGGLHERDPATGE